MQKLWGGSELPGWADRTPERSVTQYPGGDQQGQVEREGLKKQQMRVHQRQVSQANL